MTLKSEFLYLLGVYVISSEITDMWTTFIHLNIFISRVAIYSEKPVYSIRFTLGGLQPSYHLQYYSSLVYICVLVYIYVCVTAKISCYVYIIFISLLFLYYIGLKGMSICISFISLSKLPFSNVFLNVLKIVKYVVCNRNCGYL